MELSYPLIVFEGTSRTDGTFVNIVDGSGITRACARRCFPHDVAVLRELVAAANNKAQLEVDYERLGAKIDDMVEERVKSSSFVDQQTISALRSAFDVISQENRDIRAANNLMQRDLDELKFPGRYTKKDISLTASELVLQQTKSQIVDQNKQAQLEAMQFVEKSNVFYRELGQLIAKTFGFTGEEKEL